MPTETGYVLGHDDPEVERLLLQGRLYRAHTEQALRLAGLEPGMRVLDVGCGPGDVSITAAHLVGPTGAVTAVDAQAAILDVAALRAAERRLSTITFRHARIEDLGAAEPYDAVIGRLLLMHLPDPVAALRHLTGLVRPGGVVTFQDFQVSAATSVPELPLFTRVRDLIVRSFRGAGANTEMGTTMHELFRRAGLPAPRLIMGGYLGPLSDPDVMAFVMGVWRVLLPVAAQLGLDLDDTVTDLAALPGRLRAEPGAENAIAILPPLVTAWARRPG
ncbi:class I SAM-dependent methyltransferase [Amycolatopsis sp. K13G38]|uniref:Class I SAM-dependent methyltransferase n=1 Tax=Amycolatopsis acididurans TaxID=2724524 RepID=A0ABX1IYJ5_9PSEU|nr:class I SAM-dependent methyltransferase [Amycolatopsis acididurans]NKQ52226.1 class I SAM-dependent methyltransferase [Amycolatopsis acididurans]